MFFDHLVFGDNVKFVNETIEKTVFSLIREVEYVRLFEHDFADDGRIGFQLRFVDRFVVGLCSDDDCGEQCCD